MAPPSARAAISRLFHHRFSGCRSAQLRSRPQTSAQDRTLTGSFVPFPRKNGFCNALGRNQAALKLGLGLAGSRGFRAGAPRVLSTTALSWGRPWRREESKNPSTAQDFPSPQVTSGARARFSSSAADEPAPWHQLVGSDGARTLSTMMKKHNYREVYNALQKDTRVRIRYSEYEQLCAVCGVNAAEAKLLSKSLHDAGLVLYFPGFTQLSKALIIKPEQVTQNFLRSLDLEGRYTEDFEIQRYRELRVAEDEIAPLEERKAQLDYKADRWASRVLKWWLFYAVVGSGLIVRLTFWELSWDIMEPVTYLVNLVSMVTGISYFVLTDTEFSYESLYATLNRRKQNALYRRDSKFDHIKWQALHAKIEEIKQDLAHPEVQLLKRVAPGKSIASEQADSMDAAASGAAPMAA